MSVLGKIVVGCNIGTVLSGISIATSDWSINTATLAFCVCFVSAGAIFGQLTIETLERGR